MTRLIALLALLMAASQAEAAALQAEQAGGKVLIKAVADKLAAWRADADALVVVVPAESGEIVIGSLPAGVTGEKLPVQNGLQGLMLRGVSGSWQVVQDGANWVVRPGAGLKTEGALMLRDEWRVGTDVLLPRRFDAAGRSWQVVPLETARSVAGSVAGAVKIAGGAAVAAPAAAPLKPMVPVQAVAPVPLAPMAQGKPVVVSMEAAPSLKPIGQPMPAASILANNRAALAPRGGLKTVSLGDMLSRIEPAAGDEHEAPVRPALPAAPATKLAALPVAAEHAQSGLAKVPMKPAPSMPAAHVGTAASEVLPQVLGEIYIPGTLVSLTLPGLGGGHSDLTHEAPVQVAAVATPTVPPSGTWNQTTLEPIAEALAAAEAVASKPAVPVEEVAPKVAEEHFVEPALPAVVNRILPAKEGAFMEASTNALMAIAEVPENSPRERDGKMNLAAVYTVWERPEEALAVLRGLPDRDDGLPASPQARLYMGIAMLARGEAPGAGFFDQGGQLGAHARLWKAVAASKAGDYATALKLWPQERGLLPQYPAYLREMAQMAQATALVMVGDRAVAMKMVDDLAVAYGAPVEETAEPEKAAETEGHGEAAEDLGAITPHAGPAAGGHGEAATAEAEAPVEVMPVSTVPVELTRLRGLARLGTPEEAKGLQFLAAAAEDMRDPAQAYRAKFEFVRALHQRRDLSDEQVRTYLTDLWFDWRGDDLERDVLNTLANLYDKANEPREALHYWQTLVRAYPKAPGLNQITEKMTDAFLRVFNPENPKIYDTLAYAGLYYDFSELVPNDERGDMVQEQMARLLTQANLWDRAVPILENQLQFRPLDPVAQGRLALMLADSYGNTGRAADGIKLLDKWQHVATTTVLHRNWKVQEAQLLLKLQQPQAALKALAGLPADDVAARDMKIEAEWMAQNWNGSVALLQDKLATVPAAQIVSDSGAQLATLRLGYAYGQLQDADDLDKLTRKYASALPDAPDLADDLGAVAAGTGLSASIVTAGPMAPLTGELNNINRLTDRVKALRSSITAQREEQKEYNDKMRYMELLPPPAI